MPPSEEKIVFPVNPMLKKQADSSEGGKTVFLDRDGVINRRLMNDYVTRWEEFEPLPGALAAIEKLNRAGFRVVVVTNQRGIALGRMSREDVDAIHARLNEVLKESGHGIDGFFVCPHDRDQACGCRKPAPGLLLQADRRKAVAWHTSFLVGDSDSDILAGLEMGVTTIKLAGPSRVGAHLEMADLAAAAAYIAEGFTVDKKGST